MRHVTSRLILIATFIAASACGSSSGDDTSGDSASSNNDDATEQSGSDDGAATGNDGSSDASSGETDTQAGDDTAEPAHGDEPLADEETGPVYDLAEPDVVLPVDTTVGDLPPSFALSPSGDRLAVLKGDELTEFGTIEAFTYTLFDTVTGEIINTVPTTYGLSAMAWTSENTLTGFWNGDVYAHDPENFAELPLTRTGRACAGQEAYTVFDHRSDTYFAGSLPVVCRTDALTGESALWDFELGAEPGSYSSSPRRPWVLNGGAELAFRYFPDDGDPQIVTIDGDTLELIDSEPLDVGVSDILVVGDSTRMVESTQFRIRGSEIEGQPETFIGGTESEGASATGRYFTMAPLLDPVTGETTDRISNDPARVMIDAATGEPVLALIPSVGTGADYQQDAWSGDDSTYAIVGAAGIEIFRLPA